MFETGPSDRPLAVRPARAVLAFAGTAAAQLALIGLIFLVGRSVASNVAQAIHDRQIVPVVFLPDHSGPGGGGGGGGNRTPTPARKAEIPPPRSVAPSPLPQAAV